MDSGILKTDNKIGVLQARFIILQLSDMYPILAE